MKKSKPIQVPMDESQSLRIEKISNGFLAHHSTSGPKGFKSKTVYHATKPTISVPSLKKK